MGMDHLSGKRKQKQITGFKTLKEAQKVAAVLLYEMNSTKSNEKAQKNALVFHLLSNTGMRASELLTLKNGKKDV